MAESLGKGRASRRDDDFRIAMRTLELTAPFMTRDQLDRLAEYCRSPVKGPTVRQRRSPPSPSLFN